MSDESQLLDLNFQQYKHAKTEYEKREAVSRTHLAIMYKLAREIVSTAMETNLSIYYEVTWHDERADDVDDYQKQVFDRYSTLLEFVQALVTEKAIWRVEAKWDNEVQFTMDITEDVMKDATKNDG